MTFCIMLVKKRLYIISMIFFVFVGIVTVGHHLHFLWFKKPFQHSGYPLTIENNSVEFINFDPTRTQLIIHQSWKTHALPQRFQRWSTSWKKCFPNAMHVLWTDKTNRFFIAKHYPWFLPRYDRLPSAITRADAVRYLYLFHYGGLYTDLDNECLRPFWHLLRNTSIMVGAMAGGGGILAEGYVSNALMYSRPGHPFWMDVIHSIMENSNRLLPEQMTGPDVLGMAINAYRSRMKSKKVITVYPPQYFNPFSWKNNRVGACKDFNKMNDLEVIECREVFKKTSYVVQYHTHTWGGGKIL